MPLHPTIARFLADMPAPPPGPLNPEAMRAGEESQVPAPEKRLPVHTVADLTLPTTAGDVPVRVYTPSGAETHPVLVYFHGGAFFLGSLNTHDHVARELANATGCTDHQQRPGGFGTHLQAIEEPLPGGQRGQRQRGGRRIVQRLGGQCHQPLVDEVELGIGAGSGHVAGIPDPLPDLEACDLDPDRAELPFEAKALLGAPPVVSLEEHVEAQLAPDVHLVGHGLGVDAVLVTPRCADPLYRRSVRVSMGTVFQVPWTRIEPWPAGIDQLKDAGFHVAALALTDASVPLQSFAAARPERLALLLGTEGDGLTPASVAAASRIAAP